MIIALNRKCITQALVLAGTTALCLSFGTGSAFAQDDEVEEIIVTGSRIARDPNLGASVAVQSVSSEDIQLSGKMDVTDVIKGIPALMTSNSMDGSVNASAFDTASGIVSSSGESVLQLRGMGIERTLVLVDGRRHVSGAAGTAAVDINSIPQALIERIEVITGGASAIYGADAVTGVVNFIMKDDFEGLEINAQAGMASEGDGEDYRLGAVWGTNFNNDRGNFTIAVDYRKREPLRQGDRPWSLDNGIASDDNNPALRFQSGDISSSTPSFEAFYNAANGYFPTGLRIPVSEDNFITDYTDVFGMAPPALNSDELALIDRATSSPTRFIGRHRTFSISSEGGVIVPADFLYSGLDVNGNGTEDCLDSFLGYNSLFEGAAAFGLTGGCWNIDQGGVVRVYEDGATAGNFNQFGGDGVPAFGFDPDYLSVDDEKFTINLSANYELADDLTVFAEFKLVTQDTSNFSVGTGFYDLLTVAPDNPFIPSPLDTIAAETGGFFITRDPNDLGQSNDKNEREISRWVIGLEGEWDNGWGYEFSVNRGQTDIKQIDNGATIMDRYFAAIDVVSDAGGNPICRSDIDPTRPPSTFFGIPGFDPAYHTFVPGDGTCVPYNILNGEFGATQGVIDWVMTDVVHNYKMEQTVFSFIMNGDTGFGFDAGEVAFAAGTEFRIEKSSAIFDDLSLGVCPIDTLDCVEGELVRDFGLTQNSFVFDPEFLVNNTVGNFDVWELFGEVDVPLLRGASFAEELSVNGAVRFSQYSNVGDTLTWQAGLVWAPVEDIRFRGTVSTAVRAPNIGELFQPPSAATFRPTDPCEQSEIDTLIANGDPAGPIRAANCLADGIPAGFSDPLSARFTGVTSGNPDLTEEEADTFTVGFVFQPRFLEGLTLSVDYWDIEITDAIDSVNDQDIVNNCYDSATFPNQFCEQFLRERDATSAQFLGLKFLRQTQLNFGRIESSGVDFSLGYVFELGASAFDLGLQGSKVNEIDRFFDPGDPTIVDPELGEIRRPELSGTLYAGWGFGSVYVRWSTLYMDSQGLGDVDIETAEFEYGPAGFSDDFWSHDLSASWDINDQIRVFGGINNLTDEIPFLTEWAYPVGPRGTYFFLGLNYAM
jgi:outer membrane receptor protein involved in Fe transport